MVGGDGRIAVVGGGTGALGSAVVQRLVADGWRVVVPSRRPRASATPPGVEMIRCDLGNAADVDRLAAEVQRRGQWHVLVSCSGGYATGPAHQTDDAAVLAQLETNLLGPWRLSRAAALAMIEGAIPGRIVIVASRAAVDPAPGQAAYQVSKVGALRLAEVMALELRDHGITVNAVLPGLIDTPDNRAAIPRFDQLPSIAPERIAAAVAALLADDAGHVTGTAVRLLERRLPPAARQ